MKSLPLVLGILSACASREDPAADPTELSPVTSSPTMTPPSPVTNDADGDGHVSQSAGGDDCDDADPLVHPGAPDLCNGVDDDCDPATVEAAMIGGAAYASLTEAVAAAVDGDTVPLCDGRHSAENVLVDDVITLTSFSGDRAAVVLDGAGPPRGPLLLVDGGDLTLVALTLEGGTEGAVTALTPGGGPITVEDCVFQDNVSSGNGGALSGTEITISGSELVGNTADSAGGAIYMEGPGMLTLTEVTVRANNAYDGGGLYALDVSVTADDATTFQGNVASEVGGGATLRSNLGPMTWTGGAFIGNTTTDDEGFGGAGGQFWGDAATGGSVAVVGLSVTDNEAGESGGGLRLEGSVTLTDVWVEGNSAAEFSNGGGIVVGSDADVRFERVTMLGNSAEDGGAVAFEGDSYTAEWIDCVLEDNHATRDGGAVTLNLYTSFGEDSMLTVADTDFGDGVGDNEPNDIHLDFGATETSNGRLGAGETFVCDSATQTCTF